jgi:hypothetical protein
MTGLMQLAYFNVYYWLFILLYRDLGIRCFIMAVGTKQHTKHIMKGILVQTCCLHQIECPGWRGRPRVLPITVRVLTERADAVENER